MTKAFLVKHNAAKRKPIATRLTTYSSAPESYTSLGPTSKVAAERNEIYVVEVRRKASETTYWLAYKFTSTESQPHPTAKWEGKFSHKNVSTPPVPAEGRYFEEPVQITDTTLDAWIRTTQGMREIPVAYVPMLEAVLTRFGAKVCA